MDDDARTVAITDGVFVRGEDVEAERVAALEGAGTSLDGAPAHIKALLASSTMLLMEVRRSKGRIDPVHAHGDHESICYLVSGRLRVTIDGETFDARPGDSWIHRPGVAHCHEALEDSLQIEVKTPPRRAWRAAGDDEAGA